MKAFMETKDETLRRLGVDENRGLTDIQIIESLEKYGINSFTKEKPPSIVQKIWESASEPMIIMLIIVSELYKFKSRINYKWL